MMRYLFISMVRAAGVATLLGSWAGCGLSPAIALAQTVESGSAAGTAEPPKDTATPSGPAQSTPNQGNSTRQPAYDPLAARIKYLHDRLGITPAQEPLWTSLAQVMQDNAKSLAPLVKARLQVARNGNAIDTLNADEKLSEAQLDGFKKFTAAFQALYNDLTEGQKKIADAMFRLPQLSEQPGAPPPYAYYPSYPTHSSYPTLSSYPTYDSYYNFFFLDSVIGLQRRFFLHPRYPGFAPIRPRIQGGFLAGRTAITHGQFGRR